MPRFKPQPEHRPESDLGAKLRATGRRDLIYPADKLESGEPVAVPAFTLNRVLGTNHDPRARCTLHPDGTVESVTRRRTGA